MAHCFNFDRKDGPGTVRENYFFLFLISSSIFNSADAFLLISVVITPCCIVLAFNIQKTKSGAIFSLADIFILLAPLCD